MHETRKKRIADHQDSKSTKGRQGVFESAKVWFVNAFPFVLFVPLWFQLFQNSKEAVAATKPRRTQRTQASYIAVALPRIVARSLAVILSLSFSSESFVASFSNGFTKTGRPGSCPEQPENVHLNYNPRVLARPGTAIN
jgi:hypothetical protein